ncbi:acyl-CoA dehydrogenase family protein [Nocardioides sp. AE5]|uniref:acyl-CoA dehydrogenase family protein n=1 Tax=Nocardioides sp. AE5 TaxID=2962573 RepID=UPI0028814264|nr:acyl-CoA dehydrogenase family protein [Nocardioides sp. AE5]MDT0203227.1 acyl-CoA dehydrogenase family protein [Nocardioides sp. AE5]
MTISIEQRLQRRHQVEVMEHRVEDYALTFEQESLRDTVGRALGTLAEGSDTVAERSDATPWAADMAPWQRACAIGVTDLSHVGQDGALVELALCVELMGRRLLRVPFVETLIGIQVLSAIGHPQTETLLQQAVAGNEFLALCPVPGSRLVPGAAATRFVVRLQPGEIILVESTEPAPSIHNAAGIALGTDDTPGSRTTTLLAGAGADDVARSARAAWRVLQAAALGGAASPAVDLALSFATSRHTRGVPIGSLQGISHPLATCHVRLASLTNLVRRAAWFQDHEPDSYPELPAAALLTALAASRFCVETAVHVHGGAGVALESPVSDHFTWVQATSVVAGTRRHLLDEVGRTLLDRAAQEGGPHGLRTS